MNAQQAFDRAESIKKIGETIIVKSLSERIEKAANGGLFYIHITDEEYQKAKTYFEGQGFRISDWGDFRDSTDYRISWETP